MRSVQFEGAEITDDFVHFMETCVQCPACATAQALIVELDDVGDGAEHRSHRKVGTLNPLKTKPIVVDAEYVLAHLKAPHVAVVDARTTAFYEGAPVLAVEILGLKASNPHFDAKVTVLIENVRHHVKEEEEDWFPKVRDGMSRKQLLKIGARIEKARPSAPRDPTSAKAVKSAKKALAV